ncbi:DUF6456 domain-containing protein [Methylocystis rosea]|uniref:ATPase n=1 Tax=Methylocystis rosea TaxID=173366 RepID=A0A3G8M2B4_9HYPH|nr:DUF6456 domain-containing protein [Methylocystis rosea]AZG75814.1 ATPase [Methylocystis rosea]
MKKGAGTPSRDETGRVMRRLLQALAEPGARGALSALEPSTLVVLAARKGVTVARARFAAAAGDAALAEGLVRWEQEGGERRLALTDAGRAHLRRLSAPDVDQAEPFRAQHASYALRQLEKAARPTLVNDAESPLAWLARRKDREGRTFLDAAQLEAGERFRRDIEQAQLLQRVTANWEASINAARRGADAGAVSEVAIDARRRLARAFDAVGPELAGLLTDVCGYLKGMEIVESERGWPPRSAKVVLRIALDRLARHYGLAVEARGRDRAESLLHWDAEDYRPRV